MLLKTFLQKARKHYSDSVTIKERRFIASKGEKRLPLLKDGVNRTITRHSSEIFAKRKEWAVHQLLLDFFVLFWSGVAMITFTVSKKCYGQEYFKFRTSSKNIKY